MYSIKSYLTDIIGLSQDEIPFEKIYCIETTPDTTIKTNEMEKALDCIAFTLICKGECRMKINDKFVKSKEKDFFIYFPSLNIEIIDVSKDYAGICLLIKNELILSTPLANEFIKTILSQLIINNEPLISLNSDVYRRIERELSNIIYYQESQKKFKSEASIMLCSLFLIDLLNFMNESIGINEGIGRREMIAVQFLQLMSANYMIHHNVDFYADNMRLSKVYLTRIVKEVTGKTVSKHIENQLLARAEWILRHSDLSIKEISQVLNFANQASFCKFFVRLKKITPSDYRIAFKPE